MKYYLLKFESDWADEFSVYGMKVLDEDQYKSWQELFNNNSIKFPQERYFGTNEALWFSNMQEYEDCFSFTEITEIEYWSLRKYIPSYGFGFIPDLNYDYDEDE